MQLFEIFPFPVYEQLLENYNGAVYIQLRDQYIALFEDGKKFFLLIKDHSK